MDGPSFNGKPVDALTSTPAAEASPTSPPVPLSLGTALGFYLDDIRAKVGHAPMVRLPFGYRCRVSRLPGSAAVKHMFNTVRLPSSGGATPARYVLPQRQGYPSRVSACPPDRRRVLPWKISVWGGACAIGDASAASALDGDLCAARECPARGGRSWFSRSRCIGSCVAAGTACLPVRAC